MRVIGLTGGVGSGKSTILKYLEDKYQAEIIQADQVARQLQEPGEPGYLGLLDALGDTILDGTGRIDRGTLAAMIFAREDVRLTVNAVIHPMTWNAIRRQIRRSAASLVVMETALPAQKTDDIYDELWYVYTLEEVRIKRLAQSRGYPRERALAMIASQPSEAEYRAVSDYVIDNNGEPEDVYMQIDAKLGKQRDLP